MFRVAIVALLGLALAGCLSEPVSPESAALTQGPVVAVGMVDEGLNPYHELFQDPTAELPPHFIDATTGQRPEPIALSQTGTYDERVEADQATWERMRPGRLYWFVGTRLLALSMREPSAEYLLLDGGGHGTHTTSVLRNVSKDAWIVLVQIPTELAGDEGAEAAFAKAGKATAWLADQPWVDVISLSIGMEGNPPLPQWKPLAEATRLAVTRGQVVVVGAANLPSPTLGSGTNGPPWVIAVGGAEESARGWQPHSGLVVDVVADYSHRTAEREPDAYFRGHGTSFSTPVVAATLALALLEIRTVTGDAAGRVGTDLCPCGGQSLNGARLRDALNSSARYWLPQDWQPLNYSDDPVELVLFPTTPSAPTPWVQMGWGHIGPGTWRAMVDVLHGSPSPSKPPEAAAYMAQQQALREAYWSAQP